jgi:hypothetical protein
MMMIILRLHLLNHLAESLSELLDELPLEGLNGIKCIGQPVLDKALVHKMGVVHDFLTKFGEGSQAFKAVIIFRSVPDPLLLASGELALVWAVCFDANKEVVSVFDHLKNNRI